MKKKKKQKKNVIADHDHPERERDFKKIHSCQFLDYYLGVVCLSVCHLFGSQDTKEGGRGGGAGAQKKGVQDGRTEGGSGIPKVAIF